MTRPPLPSCSVAWVTLALTVPLALAATARAQDITDEHRCTGQWRATNGERIASCTALIDSGRYQSPNLAILHHDRGVAMRGEGDLAEGQGQFRLGENLYDAVGGPAQRSAFTQKPMVSASDT